MVYEADKHSIEGPAKKLNFAVGTASASPDAGVIYPVDCIYNTRYPTDNDLSVALLNSYSGNAFPAPSWLRDMTMMKWVRAVMCYYNRDRPGASNGNKWDNRADLFFFDAAVKYFKKYNYKYSYTQNDCYTLQQSLSAIDTERTNVTQLRLSGGLGEGEENVYLGLLNDLESVFNNNSSQLNCTVYTNQLEQQGISDQNISNIQKINQISASTGSGIRYLIFAMIGVAVIAGGIIIFKKKADK